MQCSSVGFWQWMCSRLSSAARSPRRLERRRPRPISTIAAQVETLETRELLTVTFNGGALIPNVQSQAIYLGSDWSTNHTYNVQAGKLDQFLGMMVQSRFMDGLTLAGYNVYRGTSTKGAFDNIKLNKSFTGGITDAQIQTEIQSLINAKKVQQPSTNALYTVFVEPGVLITDDQGFTSNNAFLGYHSGFSGKTASGTALNIHYSVIAYPSFPTAGGFTFTSLNNLTIVTSHELAEAVTDPDVWIAINTGSFSALGWYDLDLNGEVGDLVAGDLMLFQGNEIQAIADQQDLSIKFNGVMPGLTAPLNLTLTNLTPSTALLSWDSVALAQSYRVFSVSGTTRTLLGTVNSPTTTFKLTGLTAGASKSFLVEAVDGVFVADSKAVSGIAPFAKAGLQAHTSLVPGAGTVTATTPAHATSGHVAPVFVHWFDGTEDRRQRRRG